jgi:adhesin transport system outer membrane protein
MVFDGFATRSEVSRLSYTRLARYYDFMQASSNIASETVAYYENVLKFRELVRLASENYVQHKKLYDAIVQKVQAGVARGVDLELATGRLALAESNLLTEATNLHSMSARYQNLVGELPYEDLDTEGMVTTGIPANIQEALRLAFEASPQFNSVIEQVLAATSELEGRNAPFMPKLEFRARQDQGNNVSGIQGREMDRVIELVATYNLYNGGSDTAAKSQFRERLSFARDNRDKICRNLRQDLSVAYNDIKQLTEKLVYLNQHQLSISKAREAYKAQFDIGQRTLLDLLDTENEYFQAKRNYVTAKHDLAIARAKTLHNTGALLTELKVQREKLPTPQQLRQDRDLTKNQDLACPAEVAEAMTIDKAMLMASALTPASLPVTPVTPAITDIKQVCTDVKGQVNQWITAWTSQDVNGYLNQYSPNFTAGGMTRAQWVNLRTSRVKNPAKGISLSIDNVRTSQVGNRMEATFNQIYDNQTYKDTVEKTLVFDNVGGKCRIVEEKVSKGRLY